MKFHIVAVGRKAPKWIVQGIDEYAKRMRASCPIQMHQIAPVKRDAGIDVERCLAEEAKRLSKRIPNGSYVVVLDAAGEQWTTLDFAKRISDWLNEGRDVSFVIGGSDGLSEQHKENADARWSFSKLTFPHSLMCLLVVEQLYRAWSIVNRLPYHRE